MFSMFQDFRYAARILIKNPMFTTIAVLTLAVGIGATTVQFSIVDAFILRPLAFEDPERLVHVWATDRERDLSEVRLSDPNFVDIRNQSSTFEDMAAYNYGSVSLQSEGRPISVGISYLTDNMFELLGVAPALGRTFVPEDGQDGAPAVVVLSHSYWETQYTGRNEVIGEIVTLSGKPYEVIGVMPPSFEFPLKATKIWTPLILNPEGADRSSNGNLMVVGRLASGIDAAEAGSELDVITERLEDSYPAANRGRGARIVPLRNAIIFFYDMLRMAFVASSLASLFVLLIVCANVGNLLLAKATGRTTEVAIRLALGAGRGRIIRQLLSESVLLALIGGTIGAAIAVWLARLAESTIPEDLYRPGAIGVDVDALWFTLGISLLASLASGLAPAIQFTKPDIADSLKRGETASRGGTRGSRLRNVLVVSEVAMATVLLFGATLMFQTFIAIQAVDLGFTPDNVFTASVSTPGADYPDGDAINRFHETLMVRIEGLPGVEAVGAINPLPLNFESYSQDFRIDPGSTDRLVAGAFWATPGYFDALGMPLVRGRSFTAQDRSGAPRVVIVNRRMAERHFPDQEPLGQVIYLADGDGDQPATIVGLVENSKSFLLNEDISAQIYIPQLQDPSRRRFLIVRTSGDSLDLTAAVRAEVSRIDPLMPLTTVRTMNEVVAQSRQLWSGPAAAFGGLGVAALVLAMMGIYGVISFFVGQRQREIGIHMAMGADQRSIVKLVVGEGVTLTGIGLGLGLAGSVALGRLIQSLLYGTSALDPRVLAVTTAVLGVSALLASYVPARRATRLDPMIALRYE